MNKILRYDGSLPHDAAVELWFDARPPLFRNAARHWFARFRACGTDVRELVHDGCPVACVEDAPFGYVNVFKAHINVGFFRGSSLPDPRRILEGKGKFMRHVKIRPDNAVDETALQALIASAYADIKVRLKEESSAENGKHP